MKRLVCYAHFDAKGEVRPFVLHALQMMRPLCEDLVFISNSPVTDHDQTLLSSSCSHLIINNNTGYDFYMWKLGLESVDLSIYNEVVLMNSSVFGPLFDMGEAFQQMELISCDFWGITECFQMQPHLQTYFLVFSRKVIVSEAFKSFWRSVLPYTNKMQVIQSYEVGLTQWLVESGFQPGVLCPFDCIGAFCTAAGKRLRRKDNASVKFAAELLEAGSPFLKRDAVRNRKVSMDIVMPLVRKWGYPAALIDEKHYVADQSCPVCGASGRVWRKGVKNFANLHDTERYDYLRCTAKRCGIVWLKDAGQMVRTISAPVCVAEERAIDVIKVIGTMQPQQSDILLIVGAHISVEKTDGISLPGVWLAQATGTGDIQMLSSPRRSAEEYDCVILLNVLEQMREPSLLLKAVHQYIKFGGTLKIVTLNADSLIGCLFQGYWSRLCAPHTKYLFSGSVLRALVAAAGFEDVEMTAYFNRARQSVAASFEAIRNKRIPSTLRSELAPQLKTVGDRSLKLFGSVALPWGDTWYVVARKIKDL